MRKIIIKFGRLPTVILITLLSVFASTLITYSINYLRQDYACLSLTIYLSIIVPLIVAPIASWPLVTLLVKIDALERKMRELATNDSLTGLLNRRAFFHNSNNFIYFAEREQMPLSIMVVDLDKFKIINDGHGHPAGDKVLKHFGKSVKSISRDGDLAGRIGGEEFSLLLPNTSEDGALAFAERLHSFVRKSTILHGQSSIKYTISIGLVSLVPNEDDNIESIIKNADKSLYMAKEKGRNRTEIFNANKVR